MSDPSVRRIVVGVDGSPGSVTALHWACREAGIRRAEVHAIRVWEAPVHSQASYAAPPPRPGDHPADDPQMWQDVLPDLAPGVEVRTETTVGLVARTLLERCQGADMLVLGTGGNVPDRGWSAGPVIRACLSCAPCPVVVISPTLEGGSPELSPLSAGATASTGAGVPAGV